VKLPGIDRRDNPLNCRRVVTVLFSVFMLICLLSTSLPLNTSKNTVLADDSVFYDFVAQAASASWASGAGGLPFPGSASDNRGFALHQDNAQLEDNSTWIKVLETHPQWENNGWIMGRYPQLTVPSEAELKVTVGFFKGATGTDGVTFEVQFEEGQQRQTILSRYATSDGNLDSITTSLSSLSGKTGYFILYVNAGQNSGRDWAAWAEAKIVTTTPAQLPDLVTTDVWQDGNSIRYKIENMGDGSVVNTLGGTTSFCNALFIDGELVATDCVNIHEMKPGQHIDNPFDYYWEMTPPEHEIEVCADWEEDVTESNEDNNCLEQVWRLEEQPELIIEEVECTSECECLSKDEGYALGLEFCLDDNDVPVVCQVVDAEQGIYKYCFRTGKVASIRVGPEPSESDMDGDGEVNHDDITVIAAHYGGKTGTSRLPWDPNGDGIVDFKDLAIVGAHYGKSVIDEKLKDAGISTPQGLLDSAGSAGAFEDLGLRAGIAPESLLQAISEAELEKAIPGISKGDFNLLKGINMGSLSALQSLDVDDPIVLDMLHNELRLDWIASGGKKRGELLPSPDDLAGWLSSARDVDPSITVSDDGEIKFPDGSSLPADKTEEDTGGTRMPGEAPGVPSPGGMQPSSLVFTEGYPGIGGGVVAEGARPTVPPETMQEPCPTSSGYIYDFPYDVSTLKIRAERLEPRMAYNYITRQAQGIEMTVVEGKLVDTHQEFAGLSGGRITFYNTGCLSPGEWTLTPIFYGEEPETPEWHGSWEPPFQEITVSSGLEPVTDVNFTFTPIDTNPPGIDINHSPLEPGGNDRISFDVDIQDVHLLQKVEIYHWGRYSDGRQTEPELLASDFWESGFPGERSYSFELGPYPLGTPNQVHFEVAAWDYPGNPAVKVDLVRVQQLTTPPASLL